MRLYIRLTRRKIGSFGLSFVSFPYLQQLCSQLFHILSKLTMTCTFLLGEHCQTIFRAQQQLAELLPEVKDQHISELTYSGKMKLKSPYLIL